MARLYSTTSATSWRVCVDCQNSETPCSLRFELVCHRISDVNLDFHTLDIDVKYDCSKGYRVVPVTGQYHPISV